MNLHLTVDASVTYHYGSLWLCGERLTHCDHLLVRLTGRTDHLNALTLDRVHYTHNEHQHTFTHTLRLRFEN